MNGSNHSVAEPLVLVSKQVLRDTLHFMRYMADLNKTGISAALCAQTRLHGLIHASGICSTPHTPEDANQLTTGRWLPLLSLPCYLGIRPDNIILNAPYIKVSKKWVVYWQQQLESEKKPVAGINWQGKQTWRKRP